MTAGCSATAIAAPTCTSSPGPGSSDTRWSSRGVPGRPRACRLLGLASAQRDRCRSTRPPRSSAMLRMVAVRSAVASCSPSRAGHRTRASGRHGWPPAPPSSRPRRDPGTPEKAEPHLTHAECRRDLGPELRDAYEPQGLLEPDAVKAARPVLRGARHSNVPGLPGRSTTPAGGGLRHFRSAMGERQPTSRGPFAVTESDC